MGINSITAMRHLTAVIAAVVAYSCAVRMCAADCQVSELRVKVDQRDALIAALTKQNSIAEVSKKVFDVGESLDKEGEDAFHRGEPGVTRG